MLSSTTSSPNFISGLSSSAYPVTVQLLKTLVSFVRFSYSAILLKILTKLLYDTVLLKLNDRLLSSVDANNNSISLLLSQLKNSHKSTGLLVGDVVNEFTIDNKLSQGFNIPSILNLCKSVFKKLSILVTLGRTSNNLEKSIYCPALKFNDEILVIFVKGNNLPVESDLISNNFKISYLLSAVFVISVYFP